MTFKWADTVPHIDTADKQAQVTQVETVSVEMQRQSSAYEVYKQVQRGMCIEWQILAGYKPNCRNKEIYFKYLLIVHISLVH